MTFHNLSGLGPASETAALAAIAAREQQAGDVFHDRLMRAAFQPNEGYIRALASSIGINADQLITDMNAPKTRETLWLSRALAKRFAMAGTPGLVIGQTVVIGGIGPQVLGQIVGLEKDRLAQC